MVYKYTPCHPFLSTTKHKQFVVGLYTCVFRLLELGMKKPFAYYLTNFNIENTHILRDGTVLPISRELYCKGSNSAF